jgi:beta-lactam-binding protein with PASTA domain
MNAKEFMGKIASHYILLHLFAMAVVIVLLCVGVKYGLDLYTHHGEGIEVPELKGMTYLKARLLLEEEGLNIVVSDSGYVKTMPADCILAQTPGLGTKVKSGHTIYVTVNSPSSPTFAIPDIVDNSSYREAEAKLMAMGFRLTPPQEVVGEKDWVYGIVCRGRRVSNGDRVPIDYPLTLMIGKGNYDEMEGVEFVDPTYDPDMIDQQPSDMDDFEEITTPSLKGIE